MNQKPKHLLTDTATVSPLDVYFARFLSRLDGGGDSTLPLVAALASHCTRVGHVCLDLNEVAPDLVVEGLSGETQKECPAVGQWASRLRGMSVVGDVGAQAPLILDKRARVYLHRYWDYQDRLARWIRAEAEAGSRLEGLGPKGSAALKGGLTRLFPSDRRETGKERETDWQAVAAFAAVRNRFCVISGGPGTGKTTVVCRILALLMECRETAQLQIALAAPTGKAAARLQEAVRRSKTLLDAPDHVVAAIPETAMTIHRLLGGVPGSSGFRHHGEHRLPADIVVVDEASMVDLALLSKLVQALRTGVTLILLGDKNQLASVEAGAVLADICDPQGSAFSEAFRDSLKQYTGQDLLGADQGQAGVAGGLCDSIVELKTSYRFGAESGIRVVSDLVNDADGKGALRALKGGVYGDIRWVDLPSASHLSRALEEQAVDAFARYLQAGDIEEAFVRFDAFRVLCALREGPYGVVGINQVIEERLRRRGVIPPRESWYRGRPLLVTRNDYTTGIFNGDVGIVWPDGDRTVVFFRSPDGRIHPVHPARLPEHETVYAMTVHKSQGSEFDHVVFLLPDKAYPVVTRELIYTGITRARHGVEIWGQDALFVSGVSTRTRRMSGLRDLLWGQGGPASE